MLQARTERAARMKAQHVVDGGGQRCEIDAAGVGEIASRERVGDRVSLFPQAQGGRALEGIVAHG